MTPDQLSRRLDALATPLPSVSEPARLLTALERLADDAPRDRAVADALLAVHALATALDGVPPVVAGVRRETIVRWDDWTITFDGVDTATGRAARVRTLRPAAARDPVLRRALLREGRALRDAIGPALTAAEGAWPALLLPLAGAPLSPSADPDDHDRPDVLARLLGTALRELARWEDAGLGLPELDGREVLDTADGIRVACLTAAADRRPGEPIARLAELLDRWWSGGPPTPVDNVLAGLIELPPRTVADAAQAWREALAQHLAGLRHELARRADHVRRDDRRGRLQRAVAALSGAVRPADGRGAVGVDLDGRTTLLVAAAGALSWGPVGGEAVTIWSAASGVEARDARRLLRARAAAPPNPRLQAEVGGDEAWVDATCRFVAGALQLRTVRLLLEGSER